MPKGVYPHPKGRNHHHWRHGMHRSRLWRTWVGMISRCKYPSEKCYPRYGGRGIKVCEQWQNFASFMDFALANGYDDSLTIDRIDPDGNYEPSNCQFITRAQNNARRRAPKKAVVNSLGERFESISAAAKAYQRDVSRISAAVRKVKKSSAGLTWEYA
jgi:hypothetical protein